MTGPSLPTSVWRNDSPSLRVLLPSSGLTVTGQVLGSPNYLAPELAAGKLGQVGPSSDLFSIGAMLYECLTGRPPFIAATLQESLLRIRDTEPVAPRTLISGVPRDLETICLKCLQKEPSKPYATGQSFLNRLTKDAWFAFQLLLPVAWRLNKKSGSFAPPLSGVPLQRLLRVVLA